MGGADVRPSIETLTREAAAFGVRVETLEKVARLLDLLDGFNRHPALRGQLALKGGTALNLFIFEIPRLSVDIDLNYVGSPDRAHMLVDRPVIEQAIEAVCARADLVRRRVATAHAGGKWVFQYQTAAGGMDSLQVDLNFMLRFRCGRSLHWIPIRLANMQWRRFRFWTNMNSRRASWPPSWHAEQAATSSTLTIS
jgi:hypothetical protein